MNLPDSRSTSLAGRSNLIPFGLLFCFLVVTGCGTDRPSPQSDSGSDSQHIIDSLIAESKAKPEVSQADRGREALALDTTLPDRSLPPLIDPNRLAGTSHQKMLQALQQIRDRNLFEQQFHGSVDIDTAEARMQAIPESDVQKKFNARMDLGWRRLWMGDTAESIEHYLAAHALVQDLDGTIPRRVITNASFSVGLAYMRKAEDENCVQCNNGESCLLPIRDGGVHENTVGSTQAIQWFLKVLERDPEHVAARWLLNVANMTLGSYPDQVPPAYRIPRQAFESQQDFPRFANIATSMGVSEVNLSGGSIWDDFDGDGDLDLVTSSWSQGDSLLYFRNDGDNGMTNASQAANFTGLFGGLNLLQADYDNDGDLDILVLRGAWAGTNGRVPNSLLQNDGQGRFTDVTFEVGLADESFPTQTAVWADLDNDGDLDLFVGNEKYPCQQFRNDDGRFTDIASGEATRNFRYTKAVIAGDVNGDGWMDLYLSNHGQPNRLLINDGQGGFSDQAESYGVSGPNLSFAAWFWDYNNDGNLDLLVTGYSYGQTFVSESYFGISTGKETLKLYQGTSKGFMDVTQQVGLDRVVQPMGCNFGDLDNDGFLDFYLGTGCPEYDTLMPNLMFYNQNGKQFADITTSGGFGHLQKGHAISFADIDNDGDQDVFAQMGGAYPGDAAANALYRNPGTTVPEWKGRHWIQLRLIGTASNRSALGARIRVTTIQPDESTRDIYRWVGSGGSFGANPLRQEIGLGEATAVREIEVLWPNGQLQTFAGSPLDHSLVLTEGNGQLEIEARSSTVDRAAPNSRE